MHSRKNKCLKEFFLDENANETPSLPAVKRRKGNLENEIAEKPFDSTDELKRKSPKRGGWGYLPPEILVRIFGYVVEYEESALPCLQKFSRVCSNWRLASHVSWIWTCLRFSPAVINETKLKKNWQNFELLASQCFQFVRSLQCSGLSKTASKIVNLVSQNTDALSSITLVQCGTISCKNCLQAVTSRHGSKIEEFSLLRTDVNSFDLGKTLTDFGCALKRLEIINPEMPRRLNFSYAHFTNLTELRIDCGCYFEISWLQELHRLKVVHLIDMHIDAKGSMIIEWPDLVDIDIRCRNPALGLSLPDNRMLVKLLSRCPHIRRISFRNRKMDVCSMVDSVMECKMVEFLDISGFSGSTLGVLISLSGESLMELYLDNYGDLNTALSYCLHNMYWATVRILSMRNTNIEMPALKFLIDSSPRLEAINLSSCRYLPRGFKREWKDIGSLRSLMRSQGQH